MSSSTLKKRSKHRREGGRRRTSESDEESCSSVSDNGDVEESHQEESEGQGRARVALVRHEWVGRGPTSQRSY